MGKKRNVRTRREQYDEFLVSTYKKTCRDVDVLGFEFEKDERQKQFHYGLMEHALDSYLLYNGMENRAHVICKRDCADEIRRIASGFDGKEFRVMLDEAI